MRKWKTRHDFIEACAKLSQFMSNVVRRSLHKITDVGR